MAARDALARYIGKAEDDADAVSVRSVGEDELDAPDDCVYLDGLPDPEEAVVKLGKV